MPRYFFQINCLYLLSFGHNWSVFKNQDFAPKFSVVQKCIFMKIRSKVKIHHISEAGVSFEIQFGLWIKIWAGEHIFYIWQQTIALMLLSSHAFQTRKPTCTNIYAKCVKCVLSSSNYVFFCIYIQLLFSLFHCSCFADKT